MTGDPLQVEDPTAGEVRKKSRLEYALERIADLETALRELIELVRGIAHGDNARTAAPVLMRANAALGEPVPGEEPTDE